MTLSINDLLEPKQVKLFGLHERLSVPFKMVSRPNTEQEEVEVYSEEVSKLATPETTSCKRLNLYNRKTDERYEGEQYHILLDNDEYLGKPFDYYSIRSSNTSQDFLIRYKIMIQNCIVYLAKRFHSEGSYASGFIHEYDDFDHEIETILDESRKMGLVEFIEFDGLKEYRLALFDLETNTSDIVEFSEEDLVENLIGVELIRFDQEIH